MNDYLTLILLVENVLLICTAFVWGLNLLLERQMLRRPGEEKLPYNTLRWSTGGLAICLFIGFTAWLLIDYFFIDSPYHDYLTYCENLFDLLCAPLGALIVVQLTQPKRITKVRIWSNMMPFILLVVVGCLVYSHTFLLICLAATSGYLVVLIGYAHHQRRRYEKDLKETYAEAWEMSLHWLWIISVLIGGLIIYWLLIGLNNEPMGLFIYYTVAIVVWNVIFSRIYQIILFREHYHVSQPVASSTNNNEDENETEQSSYEDEPQNLNQNESEDPNTVELRGHDKRLVEFKEQLRVACEEKQLYLNPDLTRDDLAREVFMANSTFTAYLHEATHMNFSDYVNGLRIRRVTELLNTDMDITKISRLVGYRYRTTFNRVFLAHMKCTPIEYRQRLQHNKQLETKDPS